ncbi:uncharacterized protein B0I36DRAFT_368179 [Microdochium trichocladiopsis]|uniref:Oxidoreductase-like protein n=1 Tax=Microdochium trichocladiopsis TaxID=1682393 RepID=A0A9P9BK60_9PEZI|nr:uncharacterized protein B0I36DRAFT_368179 [Microdochium trichocladiopsis]KAH7018136.1 hypothetical protein B0I36DRAFT_368179 [Microdochium trichocladiopsis]
MAEHVEARSLASLNLLAANPPQYPSAPVSQRQDPVVLYISRVPGSRDIILSTQKPQLKNVTAEDVARSLYYVHLNTPEDDLLIPIEHKSGSQSPRSSSESQPIKRKPLPAQGPSHLGTEVDQLQPQPPVQQPPEAGPAKVYEAFNPNDDTSQSMPPPPPPHLDHSHISSGGQQALDLSHFQVAKSRLETGATTIQQPACIAIEKKKKKPFAPFSLTLIRRDPTQGQQWNVGQVASYQLDDLENLDQENPAAQSSPSISIHLETSGYAKFRGMPTRPSMSSADVRRSFDGRPGSSGGVFLNAPGHNPPVPSLQGGFDREVMMSYTPSFTSNIRNLFGRERKSSKGADDAPSTMPQQVVRPTHSREASTGSVTSFFGDFDGAKPVITKPGPGLRPRGYVFISPWDGRCEFVTGNAGRTLRCNHILPQMGGGAYNPLVDGDDSESGNGWPVSGFGGGPNNANSRKNRNIRAVSELRFNLPSSELLNSREKRDRARSLEGGAARARDQLQSQFSKVVQSIESHTNGQGGGANGPFGRSDSDEDFYDEDGRLNMSLGQEKAGGGNRGKRAKMGKLIIAEDGLKMLDLVVAANVGIWWAAWEKTS